MSVQVIYPKDLQAALLDTNIKPGDRLFLRGGTYTIGDVECRLSGVTIMPYPGELPIIQPLTGYRGLLFGSFAHDIIWDSINIDGVNLTNECVKITDGAYNITVRNSELKNSPWHGILISGSTTHDIIVEDCSIHDNGSDKLGHGVYLSDCTLATIQGNEIYNNAGHGVHVNGGNDAAYNVVQQNYVHNNLDRGIGAYYGTVIIKNNVLYHSGGESICVRYGVVSTLIAFNTIRVENGDTGIFISSLAKATVDQTVINNAILGEGLGNGLYVELRNTNVEKYIGSVLIKNNLIEPLFTNQFSLLTITDSSKSMSDGVWGDVYIKLGNYSGLYAPVVDNGGFDYMPDTGNPAIGKGVDVSGITTDIIGYVRTSPPTIGAREFFSIISDMNGNYTEQELNAPGTWNNRLH